MKDRIIKFMTAEQLSPTKFADLLGVQRSSISHILSGRNNPSLDVVEKMLKHFSSLNPDWLILGKGNMYREAVMPSLFPMDGTVNTNTNTIKPAPILVQENPSPVIEKKADLPIIEHAIKSNEVEQVIVFYTDKTFDIYQPAKK